jgi:hypothetical protein
MARLQRRAHRLSLGRAAQARHPRLGSRHRRRLERFQEKSQTFPVRERNEINNLERFTVSPER